MKWNLIQGLGDEQEERRVSKGSLRRLKKVKKRLRSLTVEATSVGIKPSQA